MSTAKKKSRYPVTNSASAFPPLSPSAIEDSAFKQMPKDYMKNTGFEFKQKKEKEKKQK